MNEMNTTPTLNDPDAIERWNETGKIQREFAEQKQRVMLLAGDIGDGERQIEKLRAQRDESRVKADSEASALNQRIAETENRLVGAENFADEDAVQFASTLAGLRELSRLSGARRKYLATLDDQIAADIADKESNLKGQRAFLDIEQKQLRKLESKLKD